MTDRSKIKQYYEITREKPFGLFRVYMVSGSVGSAFGFLIATMIGAYQALPMDSLVLAFLSASFIGFIIGTIIIWLFLHYFNHFINEKDFWPSVPTNTIKNTEKEVINPTTTTIVNDGTDKGKTIDFTFPEFSPDKQ